MSKLKNYVKRFLGTVALIGFVIVSGIWLFIFLTNLQIAGVLERVILPIVELIFMGALGKLFWKKFQRFYRETDNFSSALVRFISNEWVIQVSIWVLILITAIHIMQKMPLYKVVVDIGLSTDYGSSDSLHSVSRPKISNLLGGIPMRIDLRPIEQPFEVFLKMAGSEKRHSLKQLDTAGLHFESRRLLRWGQDANIIAKTKAVKVTVRTEPKSAKVWIKKPTGDSTLCPLGLCTPEKGATFKILVTADGYIKEVYSFTRLEKDTTLDISLKPEPGLVKFKITLISGQPVEDWGVHMDLYVDEKLFREEYSSGDNISLTPGWHKVYMEKEQGGVRYWVDTLDIEIRSGQHTAVACIAETEPVP